MMRRPCHHRNNVGVAPKVLFVYNEHLATEALVGEAFTECGFDAEPLRWCLPNASTARQET
jgi:hypothetical protein